MPPVIRVSGGDFAAVQDIAKTSYDGVGHLLKPLGSLVCGGGRVLEDGSDEYKALVRLVDRLEKVVSCPALPKLVAAKLLGPAATPQSGHRAGRRLPTQTETATS
jgi:hypothetical protein